MPGPGRSTRLFRFTSGFVALALPLAAGAEDLMQVYREAQRSDAVYAAARHSVDAGRERLPQGRALLLPTLNLSANAQRTRAEVDSRDPSISPSFIRYPESASYTLTFTQPLFRYQNWLQYEQGGHQVRQAEATFAQAYQDLIIRVAQAYTDVLAAHDTLALVRAQKAATAEQLAQAKRNFEVGTATITDTHEAQARYDLIAAQEIAALNDLESKRRALQLIIGREPGELATLRPDVKLNPPNPNDMQAWVELAEKQGYPVQIAEAAAEVAALEAKRNRAAHLPTLDFVATHGQLGQNATTESQVGRDSTTTVIGLQFAMPLYQGGGLTSRDRESAALSMKSKEDLDNARRNAALAARQNFLLVINGIAVVQALEQALISSQSALDSNKLGYEVGVRINIDVLNAQQQLFLTRRDLAVARYGLIMANLRLKAAAGALREEDLERVNAVLVP
ncbi:MAG TPA: TolC family outer membrane protein [Burkholderiales bacterium]|jgi:outer membrane protein